MISCQRVWVACTPKGSCRNTAFQEGFWEGSGKSSGEGFSEGFWEGGLLWDLQLKRVLRRVLRRGSEKGVSRRCPEGPLVEYAPLGVRPTPLPQHLPRGNLKRDTPLRAEQVGATEPFEGVCSAILLENVVRQSVARGGYCSGWAT